MGSPRAWWCVLVVGGTPLAFAGSGVGGVFNLGKTNTVDGRAP